MEKLNSIFLTILLLAFAFSSCKSDDENTLSESEVQFQALSGTWVVGANGSVTRDNSDSNEWNDFTITFEKNTYSTTNTYQEVWPTQGVWSFVEGNINQIQREDRTIVDINVNETTLTMSFIINESNTERKGETGKYTFILTKQ